MINGRRMQKGTTGIHRQVEVVDCRRSKNTTLISTRKTHSRAHLIIPSTPYLITRVNHESSTMAPHPFRRHGHRPSSTDLPMLPSLPQPRRWKPESPPRGTHVKRRISMDEAPLDNETIALTLHAPDENLSVPTLLRDQRVQGIPRLGRKDLGEALLPPH